MLCFSFLTWFSCWKQKIILYRKNRTNRSNSNHIGLVQILFLKSTEPNQTSYAYLSSGSDDFYPQNRTKTHREHPSFYIFPWNLFQGWHKNYTSNYYVLVFLISVNRCLFLYIRTEKVNMKKKIIIKIFTK